MFNTQLAFRNLKRFRFLISIVWSARLVGSAQPYDLDQVDGINSFRGSDEAEKLLAKQGFVVAAPEYHQIFEPYIRSPLPVFVTPDSAWHTYHIILEEGVKEMERAQALRLMDFSRALLRAAQAQSTNGLADFKMIADYASVALALQDDVYRKTLPVEKIKFIEAVCDGTEPVRSPIGFPLSPLQFKPQSFYTESPELSKFYQAHQWYACVDFRTSDQHETLLALWLSWLVENNTDSLKLWKQLSEPYDTFLASAEDASILTYNSITKTVIGATCTPSAIQAQLSEITKRLAAQAQSPRINDQRLSPEAYPRFGQLTKGFRLLPPRQLPCGVCFQNTVHPKITGRKVPSGLDFLAASPVMRSPAAVRALELQFGNGVAEAVQKADCPPNAGFALWAVHGTAGEAAGTPASSGTTAFANRRVGRSATLDPTCRVVGTTPHVGALFEAWSGKHG